MMKFSTRLQITLASLMLLFQGACASKPFIYSLGEAEVAVKSTAWVDLTQHERNSLKDKACITHLYRCDFNERGEVTGLEALDLSHPQFQEFSEQALRSWKFEPGKSGQCFVDFVYTDDPKTRIFLLPKDHAPRIARTRAEERNPSPERKNKIRSIHTVTPQYPKGSLIRGEIGVVRLRFDVSPEGIPDNVKVVHSQPDDTFERVSRAALKRWRYKTLAEEPNKDRKDVEVAFYFNIEGNLGYDCALGY